MILNYDTTVNIMTSKIDITSRIRKFLYSSDFTLTFKNGDEFSQRTLLEKSEPILEKANRKVEAKPFDLDTHFLMAPTPKTLQNDTWSEAHLANFEPAEVIKSAIDEKIKATIQIDPDSHEVKQLECIYFDKDATIKLGAPWLKKDQLTKACVERGIGTDNKSVSDLKEALRLFYDVNEIEVGLVLLVKDADKRRIKTDIEPHEDHELPVKLPVKKIKKENKTLFILYPPAIHRVNSDPGCSQFQFGDKSSAEKPVGHFTFHVTSETAFEDVVEKVAHEYEALLPQKKFGDRDIVLYSQLRKHNVNVYQMDTMEHFNSHLHKVDKDDKVTYSLEDGYDYNLIRVSVQAPQDSNVNASQWLRDENARLLAPVLPQKSSQSAKHQHHKSIEVTKVIQKLYFEEQSPLHYGFTQQHVGIMKSYLMSEKGSSFLEKLSNGEFSTNIDDYIDIDLYRGGWKSNPLIANVCHSQFPEKSKYPPKHGKIPLMDLTPQNDPKEANAGMALVANSITQLSSSMQAGNPPPVVSELWVNAYDSWDAFVSEFDENLKKKLRDACDSRLSFLAEVLNDAMADGQTNFKERMKDSIGELSSLECLKILAVAKVNPGER